MSRKNQPIVHVFRRLDALILTVIICVAFGLRLYKINTPLADYHSWRQVDTAAVARNFVKEGIDLAHPRYDDLSSIETGKENPQGYRFVEFPVYNAIFALLDKAFPWLSLEIWGRLTTAFFSLIIIGVLYYLCLKESNRLTAIAAALTYAVFPFYVFFSRVILPETPALAFSLLSIFFLYKGFEDKTKSFLNELEILLSALFFALGILTKPTTIFYGFTLVTIFYYRDRLTLVKSWRFYVYFLIALSPFLLWRNYIKAYPEGVPANNWLIGQVNTYQGLQNIFFRPAFFRWIFFERIGQNILGVYMVFYVILGTIAKVKRFILQSLLISALLYLFIFQGGNVQHEYYQTLILPAIAVAIGLGVNLTFEHAKIFINPIVLACVTIAIGGLSLFFSYYKVKDFYNYPAELPQIAKIVKLLTKSEDKIITDRMGDTTLLYLTERKGSPALYRDLEEFRKEGYKYFVTLNAQTIADTKQKKLYKIIFENNQFALFAL